MADFYGPLIHRSGTNRSIVVDPRFGDGATPTQPAGWGSGGGGGTGGGADGVLLTGPYADWGAAVNSALAVNGTVTIASGLGDIPLRTEIVIPSNRTLQMGRGTRFSVTDDHVQPTVLDLPRRAHYAMIRPDGTASAYADNITIRGVVIDGSQATPRIPSPVGTYFGIGIVYARHVLVEDCECTWLQRNEQSGDPGCYGIGSSMAEHVQFVRCRGEQNGYQNLTAYDGSWHIDFIDCYSGPGWRTGLQIHRGAGDIRIVNLVVRQDGGQSGLTMHGESSATSIKRVTILGLDLESLNVQTGTDWGGGIQCVGTVDDLTIIGARIRSAHVGAYLAGRRHRLDGCDIQGARNALVVSGGSGPYPTEDIAVNGSRLVTTAAGRAAADFGQQVGAGQPLPRVRVDGCDIAAAGGAGVVLGTGVTDAHLTGNRVRTSGAGMTLAGTGIATANDVVGTTGIGGTTSEFLLASNKTT